MEWVDYSRIVFALLGVLGAIALAALAAKKAGLAQSGFSLARKKRLMLVESLTLDARRRLAIIRCDDKEHLIILGSTGETIVETGMAAVEPEAGELAQEPLEGVSAQTFNVFRKAIARNNVSPQSADAASKIEAA